LPKEHQVVSGITPCRNRSQNALYCTKKVSLSGTFGTISYYFGVSSTRNDHGDRVPLIEIWDFAPPEVQ